jgi:DNA-binding PadR family transcriptional regulator
MTKQQRAILQFLNGADWTFGRQIMKATGIKSGTLYPALATLTTKGLLEAERELGDAAVLGRPLRIHYRITARGVAEVCGPPKTAPTPVGPAGPP